MARYVLFLIFISLQVHIPLLNSISEIAQTWKNIIKKEKSNIIRNFEQEFDRLINNNNLNMNKHGIVLGIKSECRRFIKAYIPAEKIESVDDMQKLIRYCLAKIAQAKTEYEYEQYVTEKQEYYSEVIREKLGLETYDKIFTKDLKDLPESLSYLVDGTLEQDLFKKLDTLLRNKYP